MERTPTIRWLLNYSGISHELQRSRLRDTAILSTSRSCRAADAGEQNRLKLTVELVETVELFRGSDLIWLASRSAGATN